MISKADKAQINYDINELKLVTVSLRSKAYLDEDVREVELKRNIKASEDFTKFAQETDQIFGKLLLHGDVKSNMITLDEDAYMVHGKCSEQYVNTRNKNENETRTVSFVENASPRRPNIVEDRDVYFSQDHQYCMTSSHNNINYLEQAIETRQFPTDNHIRR